MHLSTSELYSFDTSKERESTWKHIRSPEEERDDKQSLAIEEMRICMNLDEFFDVVFQVENCYIKSNTHILKARSQYFAAMFSKQNGFQEIQVKEQMVKQDHKRFHLVKIHGQKLILNCVIQYLYSDSFMFISQNINFYIQLMVFADYLMLPRLVQICSCHIKNFVTQQNVLSVLLLA